MYKLISFQGDIKHIFESESFDEILSATVDAYNQGYELHAIEKDEVCLYLCSEIYTLIKRVVY